MNGSRTTLSLGIGTSLRWAAANCLIMLAGAIAPKELGYINPLAKAARYASDRVQGKILPESLDA